MLRVKFEDIEVTETERGTLYFETSGDNQAELDLREVMKLTTKLLRWIEKNAEEARKL